MITPGQDEVAQKEKEVQKYIRWAEASLDRADEAPGDVAQRHILRAIAQALIAIAKK